MSTQHKREFADLELSEDAVHDFLAANPDFFERHSELLSALRLPHGSTGAVSLVERQVSVLRQKDLKHERQLRELLSAAHSNDALATKTHQLTLRLLADTSLAATLATLEEVLRADFDADQSILVLFGDPELFTDIDQGRFFRPVERSDKALQAFDTFLNGNGPRCGQIRDVQRDFLFGRETDEVGSVALVPLGEKSEYGFVAIGSVDADRFHPGMSIDFLARLGELIAGALRRY